MFGVLDRYLGKIIFNAIMITVCFLVSLSGMIKFVEQLRKVGQGEYSTLGAGIFTLCSLPKDIELLLPMAALLGALWGLGKLTTTSELVVMQASCFTRAQIASSVMKTAIPLVLLTMAISEWLAPLGEKMAYNYRNKMIYGGSILSRQNMLWFKDNNDYIFIEQIVGSHKLVGINIYHFDKAERLLSLRYAATATYSNGRWKLSQVEESYLTNDKQITGRQTFSEEWDTNLTPDKLSIVALEPSSLSISGLYNYVNYLKQNKQESKRYQLNMWSKIFLPLSISVMMLMALAFIFGPLHSRSMGMIVVIGISFGFLFYVLNQIFGLLILVYNIQPFFGALLPSLAFMIISIILLNYR
ncbi:LPS export ABC transporter permease LptG [Candidatus Hoaglandella endobia]|uniref:Lipopolysaccharide export system permease protein LptG n=1 Tax=Candidatus Hoaglandella endobia TaxID=1778263 RepID=A0A143WTQ4_9ENTR|nr:LPS export ABC transporter permease LptG [Candidatus Hoaglandella endobia]CUX97231.1 Lipopolysaccharide export system permease protein LptG [Candidatus Hoaglandella endobia]